MFVTAVTATDGLPHEPVNVVRNYRKRRQCGWIVRVNVKSIIIYGNPINAWILSPSKTTPSRTREECAAKTDNDQRTKIAWEGVKTKTQHQPANHPKRQNHWTGP